MSALAAVLVFIVCLAATLAASEALVRGLDRLGARLGLSEGLLGLLTALGADAPEISSALAALHAGARDVSRGVVLGSNIFNLAALLGLGALLAGRVRVRRAGLALDGGVALLATLIVGAMLGGLFGAWAAIVMLAVVFIPYLVALGLPPRRLKNLGLPGRVPRFLAMAVSEVDREAAEDPRVATAGGPWRTALLIAPAVALIVAGSTGMVSAALVLAADWHLPEGLIGAVVLAGLTSLPNAYAAARLALAGRGAAVVSEAMNSNTINLLAGIALPALLVTSASTEGQNVLNIGWLLGMTAVSLLLLSRPRGLSRVGGWTLIALYLMFVVATVTQA